MERWIYEEYKDKHPIHVDIAMQAGRAYKLVLKTPSRAREIRNKVIASSHCSWYYQSYANYFNESLLVDENEDINKKINIVYFNTKERNNIYWKYDALLSGGVYSLPRIGEGKKFCDFNTTKYEE